MAAPATQWQWLASRGVWQDYSEANCSALERALRLQRTPCFLSTAAGRQHVDVVNMHMKQCTGGVQHRIRRLGETESVADRGICPASAEFSVAPRPAAPRPVAPGPAVMPCYRAKQERVADRPSRSNRCSSSAEVGQALRPSRREAQAAYTRVANEDEAYAWALDHAERQGLAASSDPSAMLSGHALTGAGIVHPPRSGSGGSSAGSHRSRLVAGAGQRAASPPPSEDMALALRLAREEEMAWEAAAEHNHHGPAQGEDIDVDRMSYEELLALGDRIGYASRPNKPSILELSRLPTRFVTVDEKATHDGDDECSICCCNYEPGDELRTLPCLHVFHCGCIDKWLTSDLPGARSCPVCHTVIEF